MAEPIPLHKNRKEVYKRHEIELIYRPATNDWKYHIEHVRSMTLSGVQPRYDSALKEAKKDIDIMIAERRKK